MSTRPAIIALLITLLLAIGAYFILKPPAASTDPSTMIAQGERILTLDPAAIKSITLTNPPAATQVIDHTPDGRWLWRSSVDSPHQYVIDDNTFRNFLRKYNEAKAAATPSASKPLPDQPAPVTLTFRTAAGDTTLRLAPRTLGGQVLADVTTPGSKTPRAAVLADELLKVLTSPGPSAWRDIRALAADPATAARITFTDGGAKNGFGLARRDGQWFVTPPAPVTAPASGEAVQSVMKTLDSLNISRFFDDATQPTMKAAGLDKPSAILTLEFDDRSIDPATQKAITTTRTSKLILGQAADTEGTTLYATPDDGRTIYGLTATPLAALTAPASNLVMRNATRTPAADVGTIEIVGEGENGGSGHRTVKLTRDGVTGRWTETLDAAQPVTQSPTEGTASETILTFFTRNAADAVTFQLPENARLRATVTFLTPSGQPLDHFELYTGDKSGGLTVRNGGAAVAGPSVCRVYAKPPEELVRWLGVLAR